MSIRKHTREDGTISYEARYRKGKQELNRRFRTRREASSWLIQQQSSNATPTTARIRDAVEFALSAGLYKKQTPRWYSLQKVCEIAGNEKLADLDFNAMSDLLLKIKAIPKQNSPGVTISESTARTHYYTLKRSIEEYCKKHNIVLNPYAFDVKAPPSWTNVRNRRITDDEVAGMVALAPAVYRRFFRDFFFFLLQTGCRKQEALGARFSEFQGSWFHIPKEREKTRKSRKVPVFEDLQKLIDLRKYEFPDSELLFPDQPTGKRMHEMINQMRGESVDVVLHVFRHEAICRMVERTDWKEIEIMKVTGHTKQETFGRYHKLREKLELREGMSRL